MRSLMHTLHIVAHNLIVTAMMEVGLLSVFSAIGSPIYLALPSVVLINLMYVRTVIRNGRR